MDVGFDFANLPVGTRLHLGTAILEVTAPPHRGCAEFAQSWWRAGSLAW